MKKQVQFRKWPAYSALTVFFGAEVLCARNPLRRKNLRNPTAQSPSTQDHNDVRLSDERDSTRRGNSRTSIDSWTVTARKRNNCAKIDLWWTTRNS